MALYSVSPLMNDETLDVLDNNISNYYYRMQDFVIDVLKGSIGKNIECPGYQMCGLLLATFGKPEIIEVDKTIYSWLIRQCNSGTGGGVVSSVIGYNDCILSMAVLACSIPVGNRIKLLKQAVKQMNEEISDERAFWGKRFTPSNGLKIDTIEVARKMESYANVSADQLKKKAIYIQPDKANSWIEGIMQLRCDYTIDGTAQVVEKLYSKTKSGSQRIVGYTLQSMMDGSVVKVQSHILIAIMRKCTYVNVIRARITDKGNIASDCQRKAFIKL